MRTYQFNSTIYFYKSKKRVWEEHFANSNTSVSIWILYKKKKEKYSFFICVDWSLKEIEKETDAFSSNGNEKSRRLLLMINRVCVCVQQRGICITFNLCVTNFNKKLSALITFF